MKRLNKMIKKIARMLGYAQITQFLQNIFRTRYATDMYIAQCNVVMETHKKTFGEYKNKHQGQEIVIIATGPSLNQYIPIKNAINIGVNKAIYFDKIKLDYYFIQDYVAFTECSTKLMNSLEVQKFYGILPQTASGYKREQLSKYIIPESLVLKHNAKKYYAYVKRPANGYNFNVDIDKTWITDCKTVAISAMQFALFTNPKRIYLVGCDCSNGCFDGKSSKDATPFIKGWKELKEFANTYYPETEIISVNPVGLKGVFTDLYQV